MQTDYPELRAWLANEENFESGMGKSPYLCVIRDNQALTALDMLNFNSKIHPSAIVVVMPDGSYKQFWQDVYENEQNVPYEIRLAGYSAYFLIY